MIKSLPAPNKDNAVIIRRLLGDGQERTILEIVEMSSLSEHAVQGALGWLCRHFEASYSGTGPHLRRYRLTKHGAKMLETNGMRLYRLPFRRNHRQMATPPKA